MNNIITKIKQSFLDIKNKLTPKFILIDSKFETFLPNPKLRKIAYISMGSLFGFMFLIIFLGLLFSPLRRTEDAGLVLNKPKIILESPKPEATLTEKQKEILKLQTEISELKFPESILNIPVVESDLNF